MASLALYWSVMIACYLLASRLRRYADTRFGPPRTSFGPIRPIMTQIGYLLFYLLNIILYIWR